MKSKNLSHPLEKAISEETRRRNFRRVIVTVSGGADSIALLSLLAGVIDEPIPLHCNFHLRAEESNRDAHHVLDVCRSLGLQLSTKDFDVPAYIASHKGASVEMACRELRHQWFREMLIATNADRIATGHNADDNAETLLLNLFRGSGTSGLKGMVPDNGTIWRPLLSFHRQEIEEYLKWKGLDFVTDSTNLQSDFRRNFLRNEILPQLRQRWQGLDKAIDRSLDILRRENMIVESAVGSALPPCGQPLDVDAINRFPDPKTLVRRFIEPASPFTTTASEILSAIAADKPDIKIWRLRRGDIILRNHRLHISIN